MTDCIDTMANGNAKVWAGLVTWQRENHAKPYSKREIAVVTLENLLAGVSDNKNVFDDMDVNQADLVELMTLIVSPSLASEPSYFNNLKLDEK